VAAVVLACSASAHKLRVPSLRGGQRGRRHPPVVVGRVRPERRQANGSRSGGAIVEPGPGHHHQGVGPAAAAPHRFRAASRIRRRARPGSAGLASRQANRLALAASRRGGGSDSHSGGRAAVRRCLHRKRPSCTNPLGGKPGQ
jgi:hypothetical protein